MTINHILQRKNAGLAVTLLLAGATFWSSCTRNDYTSNHEEENDTMYQVSTLQSLMDGYYDGHITVGELREHGSIGLGTFDKIDGEMIVLEDTVYQARYDGSVSVADDSTTVPFANITYFEKDFSITIPEIGSMNELTAKLTEAIAPHGLDRIYVVRMDVPQCDSVFFRSELPQEKPYRPLEEVLKTDQREFRHSNIGGTVVALYFPDTFDKQNAVGWHCHFISADRTKGGHMFDIAVSNDVTIAFDATPYYSLYIP